MKIIFIDPQGTVKGFNTGLGYLAASLLKAGHTVKVLDFNNNQSNINERLSAIKDADIIGLSIKSFTLQSALALAVKVKAMNKNALLICGGPHITIDGLNFMYENTIFDVGVIGEGEITVVEIANQKPLKDISGIIYRENGKLINNPGKGWIQDLDKLPFPDYTSFDTVNQISFYPLITSRGCPYPCKYCSVPIVIGRKWRSRNPDFIIDELKYAISIYKINSFDILDDDFTLILERSKELCKKLLSHNLNLTWSCGNGIRADRVDKELLSLMKQSGCQRVVFGIESGDEQVFNGINKAEPQEKIIDAVKIAKSVGLKVGGFFIIGLPGSNFKSDLKSINFAKQLNLDIAGFGLFVPYPGTTFWDNLQNNSNYIFLRPWQEGFHYGQHLHSIFETVDYREKERIKMFYIANLRVGNGLWIVSGEKNTIKRFTKLFIFIMKYDIKDLGFYINIFFNEKIKKYNSIKKN